MVIKCAFAMKVSGKIGKKLNSMELTAYGVTYKAYQKGLVTLPWLH